MLFRSQFAFDGDPDTFFASEENPGPGDHFTVVFGRSVLLGSVAVTTGRPGGGDALDAGALEVSADGTTFTRVAVFANGAARCGPRGWVRAVRVRPTAAVGHPLVVREITVRSAPAVEVFRYPVEVTADPAAAPDLAGWAAAAARACERAYPTVCGELVVDGFKPPSVIRLTFGNTLTPPEVAAITNDEITASANYFRTHPEDLGALVHVLSYAAQRYTRPGNPPWLVRGVADYVRFFKYEPDKLVPVDPTRARCDSDSRMTAAFLAHLVETYDEGAVRVLNQVMRDGEYGECIWEELTGKSLEELEEEWRTSLRR